jgi:hypothetical protein
MNTTQTVKSALESFLTANGFTTDAYTAPTVAIPIGPLTFTLPNSPGRQELVRWHDVHHVVTGYGTDIHGEAEIGAWELRAGCTNLASYVYNGMAVLLGLFVSPIRTVRAFFGGRGMRTLYLLRLDYDAALSMSVGELRDRMGLPPGGVAQRPARLHSAAPVRA